MRLPDLQLRLHALELRLLFLELRLLDLQMRLPDFPVRPSTLILRIHALRKHRLLLAMRSSDLLNRHLDLQSRLRESALDFVDASGTAGQVCPFINHLAISGQSILMSGSHANRGSSKC